MNIKKVTPLFTSLVTTMDKYVDEVFIGESEILDTTKSTASLKEYQTVVAIGSAVRSVKVGDLVCINPKRFEIKKQVKNSLREDMEEYSNAVVGYNFNVILLDNVEHLLISENDIDFIIDEYETV